jgi:hypothetical protein
MKAKLVNPKSENELDLSEFITRKFAKIYRREMNLLAGVFFDYFFIPFYLVVVCFHLTNGNKFNEPILLIPN